jgi:plasmid stabilization system protein ParE
MSRQVCFHPAAQRELDEAAEFYDAEGIGLGAAFLDEAEHALKQIRDFPESSPSRTIGAGRSTGMIVNRRMSSGGFRPERTRNP